ncbi:MAG: helix-turn-helix domain-containing protein [Bacteroidales bacterium]|nr:helix-turn-helix domain-containing protein [Bacteroidales bacterium]
MMLASCGSGSDWTEREIAASDRAVEDAHGDLDALYATYTGMSGRTAVRTATMLMRQLDELEFLDEPITYSPSDNPKQVRAEVDWWMAEWLNDQGRWADAEAQAQRAVESARAAGDKRLEADAWSTMTLSRQQQGDPHGALAATEESYRINQMTGDKKALSSDLNNLAFLALALDKAETARQYIDRAIETEEALGRDDTGPLAIRYGTASEVYMKLGQAQKALTFAAKALALDSVAGRDGKTAIRRSQVANALLASATTADTARAALQLKLALPALCECGNVRSQAIVLNQLADIESHRDRAAASALYEEAWTTAMRSGDAVQRLRASRGLWRLGAGQQWVERYALLTDSVHRTEIDARMQAMQRGFENRELELENQRLEAQATYRLWVGVLLLIMVLGLTFVIYWIKMNHRRLRHEQQQFEHLRVDIVKHMSEKMSDPLNAIVAIGKQVEADRRLRERGHIIVQQAELILGMLLNQGIINRTEEGNLPEPAGEDTRLFLGRLMDETYKLMKCGNCSVGQVAQGLGMSSSTLNRRVREATDATASQYIMRIRIEHARNELKAHPDRSINEIGHQCGFDDMSHFGRIFKQVTGMTPTEFRKAP